MIPKIIHYCWLSKDPVPSELKKCMDSWREKLPEYEIKIWNFDCFDVNSSIWVKEAFEQKKYAFAADFIRLFALYKYGGIYLDMDVEVIKSFDNFLHQREILCVESSGYPEVATFGCEKGCDWLRPCLNYYDGRKFVKKDGSLDTIPLPKIIKNTLEKNGYCFKAIDSPRQYDDSQAKIICTLPCDYFSPKSYVTGKLNITKNTVSIHHFAGTWIPWYEMAEKKFWGIFGKRNKFYITKCVNIIRRIVK